MKLKKRIYILVLGCVLMNFQCEDSGNDDAMIISCGIEVVNDSVLYESAESSYFGVLDSNLEGNCLSVTISSSGCDASTWGLTLIDSETITESLPPQRELRLIFYNNEACLAVLEKEEIFDLVALQVEGANEVVLNIEGLPESILYTY
ncbi:hypothetical protein [Winogradskyella sediminis]|uniref:hypothetical protein n=1 Tax=Winogradskyella sediminis TaxID=1382466 RepID=UPI000E23CC9E|nr:hypothetical protein [Winogradskyella sediminis]REG90096.1 hypothetical protein C8N41_1011344 [Winogradskyella sediminis]